MRNSPAEAVGVDVEQCKISEQTQLLRQVPGDVSMVEINAGDGVDRRIVQSRRAEYPGVVTHGRSDPVDRKIVRIGENGLFPSLQRNVGVPLPRVLKHQRRIHGYILPSVTELIPVIQELTPPNVHDLGVSEVAMAGNGDLLRGTESEAAQEEERVKKNKMEGVGLLLHLTPDITPNNCVPGDLPRDRSAECGRDTQEEETRAISKLNQNTSKCRGGEQLSKGAFDVWRCVGGREEAEIKKTAKPQLKPTQILSLPFGVSSFFLCVRLKREGGDFILAF